MRRLLWLRLGLVASLITFLFHNPGDSLAQSTIDLVVHYVQGEPAQNEIAYDVSVYLSLVDSAGNAIKDLTPDVFTVTEDSQKVEIKGLELGQKDPINIVLVMDTSGSMGGTGITAAKTAASNFVSTLATQDQVAVVTFDNIVKTQVDFTPDHAAVKNQIALIDSVRGAGTCLYDAAYQAIQMASTLPSGSRAIVLFTDGVDETPNGSECSTHTTEDVIKLATEGGTRTPIYTMGMGNRLDPNILKRFAELSGGRYLFSPDSTQLDSVFQRLSEQLRSQYVLTYTSVSGPGAHTLAVSANYLDTQDSDTRNFLLPAMPTRISFISPVEGATIENSVQIAVSLSGQGETVDRVAFEIDGKVVGTDDTVPYEIEVDLASYSPGDLKITAIAYSSNNAELVSKSITTMIASDTLPVSTAVAEELDTLANPVASVAIGLGGLLVVSLLLVAVVVIRRRRSVAGRELDKGPVGADRALGVTRDERTLDDWEMSPDALGMLIVDASDDPSMLGHRFEMRQTVTTIGRSTENDVAFPKDKPVSRRHAEIVKKSDGLYLVQVESTDEKGVSKTPTYGTFINDVELTSDPILLQNGDEIRLGKRVRLKFESANSTRDSDSITYDGIMSTDDPDRTYDQQ